MKRVARGQCWKCPTGFAGLNDSRLAPYRDTVQTMVTTTTMSMSVGSGVRRPPPPQGAAMRAGRPASSAPL